MNNKDIRIQIPINEMSFGIIALYHSNVANVPFVHGQNTK